MTMSRADALQQRSRLADELAAVKTTAEAEHRALTDAELLQARSLAEGIETADRALDHHAQRDELASRSTSNADAFAGYGMAPSPPTFGPQPPAAVVRTEPDTYRPDGAHHFAADVLASRSGESGEAQAARERLQRHRHQHPVLENRARASTNLAGVMVPNYMIDEYQRLIRTGRPTAEALGIRSLSSTGWPLRIPQETTGFTAGYASENSDSVEGGGVIDATELPVKTVRGAAELSLETVHRGEGAAENVILSLMDAVDTAINDGVINGGANAPAGLLTANAIATANVVDDDASAKTTKDQWQAIVDTITRVATNGKCSPTHVLMHPRRFGGMAKALDSDGRPLFQAAAMTAANTMAHGGQPGHGMTGVQVAGVPVVIDAGLPINLDATDTDQDAVFAIDASAWRHYETGFMVLDGEPNLKGWKRMFVVAKYVTHKLMHPTRAGYVRGEKFATDTVGT